MSQREPSYHSYDEYRLRLEKLNELREMGIDPYPNTYQTIQPISDIISKYEKANIGTSETAQAGKSPATRIAGRLVLFRAMGKNAFGHIQDDTGRLQIMFNREDTQLTGYTTEVNGSGEKLTALKIIEKKIDLGDLIGVYGNLFHTQKGELTLYVKEATLLCKTLLPLPDKHSGLADKELRYRKRWLDLICHPDVRQTFLIRSKILREIRRYLEGVGFIEVETPVLQGSYGGAEARPFTTLLNALDQEMFMRISLEIPLKKLLVGGMARVFEIGKVFRNEGIDRTHNPEFTMLEAYASYWDYNDMMRLTEELWQHLAVELFGGTKIPALHPETGEPIELDLRAPWKRLTMIESLKLYAKLDPAELSDDSMRELLLKSGHVDPKKLEVLSRGLLIAALFEAFVEPHLIQPHHIIDHPIETTPLCKLHRDPVQKKAGIVERFESFILCREVCNAYSELNDPVLQRQLLEQQAARRDAGDEEASPLDEEFVEAICQGMPPAGGVGIGIDRLVMILTNSASIRDVLYFPWMKEV